MIKDPASNALEICFLSFTHPYDDTRVFHKEAVSLADAGYRVTHLTPGDGRSWSASGVRIVTFVKRVGLLGKLASAYRLVRAALLINADCYHCNEVESWVIGCFLKLFRRRTLVVFDVHEHYPSRASEPHFPYWFRYVAGPVVRVLYAILPPVTDFLIYAKRSVAPDFKYCDSKSEYIFNYAPLRMQNQIPAAKDSTGSEDMPVAIHIGGMSRARGWPQLLDAVRLSKHKDLRIVLLGGVSGGNSELTNEAARLGIGERIEIKPPVPYEQVFEHLRASRMGLILYQPGILNHTYAFPIKMYDYMLAGIPFIAPDFSIEVTPVVNESRCGLLVDTSKPEQIAAAMDWLFEHPQEAREMGLRGKRAVIEKYNWESEKNKLLAVYERLATVAARS